MGESLKRLSFGFFLIALASAVLLLSDTPRQKPRDATQTATESTMPTRTMRVAMFQMASQPIIDEGAQGVIDSLKESGFVDGKNLKLTRFNAEGDMATGNAISQELANGDYDLIITLTTGALQSFANVNKQRKVPHIFGLVSDPVVAGVGIGKEPMDHPAHLTGIGTFPPVDQALELARKFNPKLSKVGIGWNPAEINSEVSTKLAREVCKKLKIELLEANVENTSTVKEAVRSLIDRQAEALLIGGDVTMLGAIDVVAKTGSDAHIPTFTCMPGNAKKGALFDVGANYYEVGRTVGRVAARVLMGDSISSIPVEIAIPPKLFLNKLMLKNLDGEWAFPDDVIQSADSFIDEAGQHDKARPSAATSPVQNQPLSKLWQLRMVSYVNSDDVSESERGLRDGLKKAGLVEGRDYDIKMLNAQGDMTTLIGLADAAIADNADMLLTISTQALQSCVQRGQSVPIVFTMVANPFAAGVGKSESDHLPNVTGAYGANDVKGMMPVIKQLMPGATKLGTLYVPGEVNSVYSYELLVEATAKAGYELVSRGVNASNEVLDGTQSLCEQHLDAICLSNSNLTGVSFPSIAQAASKAKLPVFAFLGSASKQGATAVLTRDYYDMGLDSAQIAARVMRGEKPASIPFFQSTKSKLYLNLVSAQKVGISIPETLIKSADQVIDK